MYRDSKCLRPSQWSKTSQFDFFIKMYFFLWDFILTTSFLSLSFFLSHLFLFNFFHSRSSCLKADASLLKSQRLRDYTQLLSLLFSLLSTGKKKWCLPSLPFSSQLSIPTRPFDSFPLSFPSLIVTDSHTAISF
jgi:hypothetical protein